MTKPSSQSIYLLLTTALTIAVNALANILPFNGQTSREVSDKYFTAFTPAGYAFAIWSVIYLGLMAFSVFQTLPSQRERWASVRRWVILSNLANASWLPLFHYELFGMSIVVMAVLLFSLFKINHTIDNQPETSLSEQMLAKTTFGIYFGWVSVATIANVAVALTAWQWEGWGIATSNWAVIMLVVGLGVGVWVQSRIKSYAAYLLVFVWAYWAIHQGQSNVLVQQTAQLGAFVGVALVVVRISRGINVKT